MRIAVSGWVVAVVAAAAHRLDLVLHKNSLPDQHPTGQKAKSRGNNREKERKKLQLRRGFGSTAAKNLVNKEVILRALHCTIHPPHRTIMKSNRGKKRKEKKEINK